MRATASLVLSYRIERGTLPKSANAPLVPDAERLGSLRRIGPHKARVTVGRSIAKKWIFLSTPAISPAPRQNPPGRDRDRAAAAQTPRGAAPGAAARSP